MFLILQWTCMIQSNPLIDLRISYRHKKRADLSLPWDRSACSELWKQSNCAYDICSNDQQDVGYCHQDDSNTILYTFSIHTSPS